MAKKPEETKGKIMTPLNVDKLITALAHILAEADGCEVVSIERVK